MILENTTVVYNPETIVVLGEFKAGTEIYTANNVELYEGTLDEFLAMNKDYSSTEDI